MRFVAVFALAFCLALSVPIDIHIVVPKDVRDRVVSIASLGRYNQINFVNVSDPHITLYLTDFEDSSTSEVISAVKKVFSSPFSPCSIDQSGLSFSPSSGGYVLWMTSPSPCLQLMSDAVVRSTHRWAKKNQPIPSWVMQIQNATERREKIEMQKKYGSPNVFGQFSAHVTVAYDTQDNASSVWNSKQAQRLSQHMSMECVDVAVGSVGPFGTVLKNGTMAIIPIQSKKQAQQMSSSNNSWDYFLLVREWCGTMSPGPLPSYVNTFTLHGMWPNRLDGSWPQFCNSSYPFNYAEIADIIVPLDRAWYDTMHDQANGTDFWSHEWDKHGTCAMSDRSCCGSERQYFQSAIQMHDRLTEAQWLANAGIVPADQTQTLYAKSDFINALQQGLGVEPLIRCTNLNGINVIMDVGVCVDKSLKVMKCPQNQFDTWQREAHCNDQFGYPLVPH